MSKRQNGFSPPISSDQLKCILIYPPNLVAYYLLVSFVLADNDALRTGLQCLNGILALIVMTSWFLAEYIDPEQTSHFTGIPVVCFPPPEKSARYCGGCRKTVTGLDHHCSWLNTCIGRRNYVFFFVLVLVGAVQHLLHVLVGIIAMALWMRDVDKQTYISSYFHGALWAFYLVVCAFVVLSATMATGFLLLLAFHSYLLLVARKGTYDWLLARRGGRLYEQSSFSSSYHTNAGGGDHDEERREHSRREKARMSNESRGNNETSDYWQKSFHNGRNSNPNSGRIANNNNNSNNNSARLLGGGGNLVNKPRENKSFRKHESIRVVPLNLRDKSSDVRKSYRESSGSSSIHILPSIMAHSNNSSTNNNNNNNGGSVGNHSRMGSRSEGVSGIYWPPVRP